MNGLVHNGCLVTKRSEYKFSSKALQHAFSSFSFTLGEWQNAVQCLVNRYSEGKSKALGMMIMTKVQKNSPKTQYASSIQRDCKYFFLEKHFLPQWHMGPGTFEIQVLSKSCLLILHKDQQAPFTWQSSLQILAIQKLCSTVLWHFKVSF